MRALIVWPLLGARNGAALLGVTVAVLGGASLSLLLFFWGTGVVLRAAAARLERRGTRSPKGVLS